MALTVTRRPPGWLWIASILFWTGIGGMFVLQELVFYHSVGQRYSLGKVLAEHALEWGVWAVATPLLICFIQGVPPRGGSRLRLVRVYLAAGAVVTAGTITAIAAGRYLLPWHSPEVGLGQAIVANFARLFAYSIVLFTLVIALSAALAFRNEARERELAHARAEALLGTARADVLTMQLQPHFLFNALNTIAGLIRNDPAGAERMVVGLGDLLRVSLRTDRPALIPLAEEMEFVRRYLDIQGVRFRDRLSVELAVPAELRNCLVPTFLLQPLVENVIRHAVTPQSAPVKLVVEARRSPHPEAAGAPAQPRLLLVVRDDGPGPPPPERSAEGIGLRNTRERLAQLFGPAQSLELRARAPRGTEVVISIPFQMESD